MRFLLIHSPLVTKDTWLTLVASLEAVHLCASIVTLDNHAPQGKSLFEHHNAQIESILATLPDEYVIAVAHSAAGNLLAFLDPDLFHGHIFLDAIFPIDQASRFELFDDPNAVSEWRKVAIRHDGMLPKSMLARFGEQIEYAAVRRAFLSGLVDAPVLLYEESIPVHPSWPRVKRGLYLQWTDSYSADAARAAAAGFDVRRKKGSHLKMLNEPDDVARELAWFAGAQDEIVIDRKEAIDESIHAPPNE